MSSGEGEKPAEPQESPVERGQRLKAEILDSPKPVQRLGVLPYKMGKIAQDANMEERAVAERVNSLTHSSEPDSHPFGYESILPEDQLAIISDGVRDGHFVLEDPALKKEGQILIIHRIDDREGVDPAKRKLLLAWGSLSPTEGNDTTNIAALVVEERFLRQKFEASAREAMEKHEAEQAATQAPTPPAEPALLTSDEAISILTENIRTSNPSEVIRVIRRLMQPDVTDFNQTGNAIRHTRNFLKEYNLYTRGVANQLEDELEAAINHNSPLLGEIEEILGVAKVLGIDISQKFRRINEESNGAVAKRFFDEMVALARRVKEEPEIESQLFRLAFAGEALFSTPEYTSYDKLGLAQKVFRNAGGAGFLPAWKKLAPQNQPAIT